MKERNGAKRARGRMRDSAQPALILLPIASPGIAVAWPSHSIRLCAIFVAFPHGMFANRQTRFINLLDDFYIGNDLTIV